MLETNQDSDHLNQTDMFSNYQCLSPGHVQGYVFGTGHYQFEPMDISILNCHFL